MSVEHRGPHDESRTPPAEDGDDQHLPRLADAEEWQAAWAISGYLWESLAERGDFRVGVVCDVGETMAGFAEKAVSLAWVITAAAHHVAERCDTDSSFDLAVQTSAVQTGPELVRMLIGQEVFGARPIPPITPGGPPRLTMAVDEVHKLLWLGEPGPARLLVLITDARHHPYARLSLDDRPRRTSSVEETRDKLEWLRASGCGVLWLCPATAPCTGTTFPGTALVIDPDHHLVPAMLAEAIRVEIDRPGPHLPGDEVADGAADEAAPVVSTATTTAGQD